MKIIKTGNLEYCKKPIKFTCRECTCIFEAERGEYSYCGTQREGDDWRCECPVCKNTVYSTAKIGW